MADSPYDVRVVPARPSVKHCTVVGDGRRNTTVGRPAHFIVEARDEFGNRWARGKSHAEHTRSMHAFVRMYVPPAEDGLYHGEALHGRSFRLSTSDMYVQKRS